MPRLSDYSAPPADPVAYNRTLYGQSERHRLARINHTRRRRGKPEAQSLDEVDLRR